MDKGTFSAAYQTQTCECGEKYEALYILGEDFSSGLCYACRDKKAKGELARLDALRRTESHVRRSMFRKSCGIPEKYQRATFDSWERQRPGNVDKVMEACKQYAEAFPMNYLRYRAEQGMYPSLVLLSPGLWGVGKTHLACAIANRILDRWDGHKGGCPVMFVSEPDIYHRIQATYNYSPDERNRLPSEQDIIDEMLRVPLLILDDVGKVPRSDPRFIQAKLFAIVNGRYNTQRPIVMTTNKNNRELERYFGESEQATFDRLWEMCESPKQGFWQMTGESYRRQ